METLWIVTGDRLHLKVSIFHIKRFTKGYLGLENKEERPKSRRDQRKAGLCVNENSQILKLIHPTPLPGFGHVAAAVQRPS